MTSLGLFDILIAKYDTDGNLIWADQVGGPESDEGYDVEIDLWFKNDKFYLGHDNPQYEINIFWIQERVDKLWVHAKNFEVIQKLLNTEINWFWHENDKLTMTSKGFLWCYPNVYIENGITVTLDYKEVPNYLQAVCTDGPIKFTR